MAAGRVGALEGIIGLFLIFTVGLSLFNNTILQNNGLINTIWTIGIPVGGLILVFRAVGIIG